MSTSRQKLWWHMRDGAVGACVDRLRAQRPAQAKVCNFGTEAALVGITAGQQNVAAGKVAV